MDIEQTRLLIDRLYQRDARRIKATLIRLLGGNFDLAEEALHDAVTAALDQWPRDGIPDQPRAWLVSTGRFKAIDRLRRQARFDTGSDGLLEQLEDPAAESALDASPSIEDDRLRLIFTCCHPSLAEQARIALTLREVCGLTTEEIATAFLVPASTLAQRIVRAKHKIRDARIPYEIPAKDQLPERLASVLHVIYLVFNEGYSASAGADVTRHNLCAEAIRLARLLEELLPEAEVRGLLALMLLHDARSAARMSASGELIPLEEQDRRLWNQAQIAEGCRLTERALREAPPGPYALQAAIAAVHCEAGSAGETDWPQIAGLYAVLMRMSPTPVIALNHGVAVAMRDGPAAGLALLDTLEGQGELAQYHLFHAARADLLRRLGQHSDARQAYRRALELTRQGPERRFMERRLAELAG